MRATIKHINTKALSHNLQTLSRLAPQSQCIAVIKANAYGCEATKILSALKQADLFAVAAIEEALAIRSADSDNIVADKPIILLEGAFEESEIQLAYDNDCELVVGSQRQLEWLLASKYHFSRVWFKLDSGMGRLGFQVDSDDNNAEVAMEKLLTHYKQEEIVIMTHFSDADNPDSTKTLSQIACFDSFAEKYPRCQQSLCASAGTLKYPQAHRNYIRLGIALYGASPFADKVGKDFGLQPVMSLKSRIMSVKTFKAGSPIGYGEQYRLPTDGKIAICELGYADGYLRSITSETPILVNGTEYKTAGRVAMDMTAIIVDDEVKEGDEVIAWGEGLPIEIIANAANTISYQLMTTVTERPQKVIEF